MTPNRADWSASEASLAVLPPTQREVDGSGVHSRFEGFERF
jgi:hypothetical protein